MKIMMKELLYFRATCNIDPTDSPEEVQVKVQELEALHFAKIIESVIA